VETVFAYSPQDTIYGGIRLYTDTIDLSSEYEIEGYITTYKWFDITGGYEEDIEQPTNENGIFYFTEAHANKRLRCKMSNEKFPVGYPAVFWFVYETDIVDGIKEISINTWEAYPNITNSESVVTLDLENSGNLIITLNDVLGNEVLELYNNYAYIGTFTKEFSIKCLPQGLYYIKAIHNGNIKIGKIIKM